MWRTLAILVAGATFSAWPRLLPANEGDTAPQAAHFLVIRLNAETFAEFANKPIDRMTKVNEDILGTRVVGSSLLTGQTKVQLTENAQQAGFDVVLTGTTRTRTKGYNGPVVLHSRGATQFRAVKHVVFDPQEGFRAGPAIVEAKTRTVTDDVEATRGGLIGGIIRRRAWEEVAARRAESERIASDKTKRRIAQLFDDYLAARLGEINRGVGVREVVSLLRASGLNPAFASCTKSDCLLIAAGRGSCDLSCLDLPRCDRAPSPIQVWIQPVVIAGTMGKAIAPTVRSSKGVISWFERLQNFMSIETSLLAASSERPSLPFELDAAGDWIVLHFGEPAPELVAQRQP